ncbi:MAG: non-ribosomal peptide synthase, partial [bacterium]|nr:non-ribosomal peptide synthase [bacterium]
EDFKDLGRHRFDLLSGDPAMKLAVLKLSPREHEMTWYYHHILMDGWCLNILFKEVLSLYLHFESGCPLELEPPLPYKNYIKWLEKQDKSFSADYWAGYLEHYREPLSLPGSKESIPPGAKEDKIVTFGVEPGKAAALLKLANSKNSTLYNVIQAVWSILLSKYSGGSDVVMGQVVSGRPEAVAGVESMVGLFINTVPKRVRIDDEQPFHQLVADIAADESASSLHHHYPLGDIFSAHPLKNRLFRHIIVFENHFQLMDIKKEVSG